jgi:hypothetical protein
MASMNAIHREPQPLKIGHDACPLRRSSVSR